MALPFATFAFATSCESFATQCKAFLTTLRPSLTWARQFPQTISHRTGSRCRLRPQQYLPINYYILAQFSISSIFDWNEAVYRGWLTWMDTVGSRRQVPRAKPNEFNCDMETIGQFGFYPSHRCSFQFQLQTHFWFRFTLCRLVHATNGMTHKGKTTENTNKNWKLVRPKQTVLDIRFDIVPMQLHGNYYFCFGQMRWHIKSKSEVASTSDALNRNV